MPLSSRGHRVVLGFVSFPLFHFRLIKKEEKKTITRRVVLKKKKARKNKEIFVVIGLGGSSSMHFQILGGNQG